MKKKLLASFIAMVMVFTTMTTGILADTVAPKNNVPISVPRFIDMPDGWSRQALEMALANNLLIGHAGKIMANKPLTRAEIATILGRAFKCTVLGDISKFHDVNPSDWYYDEMQLAVGMGIMIGHAGELYPNSNISREAAFTILARALQLEDEVMATSSYIDEAQISLWAKSSISALTRAGYLEGHDGRLRPQDPITRAEFAQVMNNLIKEYINTPGMYNKVEQGNVMVNSSGVTLSNLTVKGDLILADGIGDGTVTLSSIHIKGRLIVRGGGVNSIILKGSTQAPEVYVAKGAGSIRIAVESSANIRTLTVAQGEEDIILEGNIKSINIKSDSTPAILKKAKVEYMNVFSNGASLVVNEGSKVDNLYLLGENGQIIVNGEVGAVAVMDSATDASISLSEMAKIGSIITDASKMILTNEGYLGRLSATKKAMETDIVMGDRATISKVITASKANIVVRTMATKIAEECLANAKTVEEKTLAETRLAEAKKAMEVIVIAINKCIEEKTVKAPTFADGVAVDAVLPVVVPPISIDTDDDIVLRVQRASLKDAGGNEVSQVDVAREGASLTYNLSVNQLLEGKEVLYAISKTDSDSILTYQAKNGKITKDAPNVTLEFTIADNGVDELAKTATITISFTGDYGKISDKVITINLERGLSQDEVDVAKAKTAIENMMQDGKLSILSGTNRNLIEIISTLGGIDTSKVTITLNSSHEAIANDGAIGNPNREVTGDVVIIISKGIAEVKVTVTVIVPVTMN